MHNTTAVPFNAPLGRAPIPPPKQQLQRTSTPPDHPIGVTIQLAKQQIHDNPPLTPNNPVSATGHPVVSISNNAADHPVVSITNKGITNKGKWGEFKDNFAGKWSDFKSNLDGLDKFMSESASSLKKKWDDLEIPKAVKTAILVTLIAVAVIGFLAVVSTPGGQAIAIPVLAAILFACVFVTVAAGGAMLYVLFKDPKDDSNNPIDSSHDQPTISNQPHPPAADLPSATIDNGPPVDHFQAEIAEKYRQLGELHDKRGALDDSLKNMTDQHQVAEVKAQIRELTAQMDVQVSELGNLLGARIDSGGKHFDQLKYQDKAIEEKISITYTKLFQIGEEINKGPDANKLGDLKQQLSLAQKEMKDLHDERIENSKEMKLILNENLLHLHNYKEFVDQCILELKFRKQNPDYTSPADLKLMEGNLKKFNSQLLRVENTGVAIQKQIAILDKDIAEYDQKKAQF